MRETEYRLISERPQYIYIFTRFRCYQTSNGTIFSERCVVNGPLFRYVSHTRRSLKFASFPTTGETFTECVIREGGISV